MSSRVVNVDIHGQRYAVKSDLDPQYIAELARFLDEKMNAASRELATSDPLRIAVIAALNISDELHRARIDSEGADGHVRARGRNRAPARCRARRRQDQRRQSIEEILLILLATGSPLSYDELPALCVMVSECRLGRCFTQSESRCRVVCMPPW